MGDSEPWSSLVSAMWGALADPTGSHAYPLLPGEETWPTSAASYWTPLTHLMRYGFGWLPTQDNETDLEVMGRGLLELIGSGFLEDQVDHRAHFMAEVWGSQELEDFANWCHGRKRPRTDAGRAVAEGDRDPLHLQSHWSIPSQPLTDAHPTPTTQLLFSTNTPEPHAALLLDCYGGWYRELTNVGERLDSPTVGTQWWIDVIVRPIGWLGTFRQSHETSIWFTGSHHTHQMAHY